VTSFLLFFGVSVVNPQRITTIRATFNVGQNHSNEVFPTTTPVPDPSFCPGSKPCMPGLIIPVWQPQVSLFFCQVANFSLFQDVPLSTKIVRASVYLLGLCYLFFGVSIVSDR
jgi:hypothetical protein